MEKNLASRTSQVHSKVDLESCMMAFFSRIFNAQSVRNKRLLIKDFIIENNVDIFALSETWLHPDDRNDQVIGDLIPDGYSFHHVPRQLSNGGGVGIPVKNGFCVKESTGLNRHFVPFNFIDLLTTSDFSRDIHALVIYYPPCNLLFHVSR